jgi:hypothetical protein
MLKSVLLFVTATVLSVTVGLAQTVTSVSFQVPAPAGATSAKVSVYDEDSLVDPDDMLTSLVQIGTINGGTFDTGDLSTTPIPGTDHFVLRNEGGEVAGGAGSSGEETAEI